jgi:hypothetical protein
MQPKPCSLCGSPADVSFVILASTLRIRPRRQNTSASVPFCQSCINGVLSNSHFEMVGSHPSPFTDALTNCFGALTKQSSQQINPVETIGVTNAKSQTSSQPTSQEDTDASCRPCLIACNSRHYDEVCQCDSLETGLKEQGRD